MEARIVNFELGGKRQYPDRVIIEIEGVKSLAEAMKFINKKVVWITPTGKKIIGKIRKPHGRKGRLLAVFRKGLPGQALGTRVIITG